MRITLEFNNSDELNAQLKLLYGLLGREGSVSAGNGALDKVEVDEESVVETAAEEFGLEEAPKKRGPKTYTLDEVKDVLTKHVGKYGQKATVKLVEEQTGVKTISAIPTKSYGKLVKAVNAELAE